MIDNITCLDSACNVPFIFYSIIEILNRNIRMYISPILIIMGVFGHMASCTIFILRQDISGTCRVYYLCLSIGELRYFIFSAIPRWTGDGLYFISNGFLYFWPERNSILLCRIFKYCRFVSTFIAIWSLVIYSIERVLAIRFPFLRTNYIRPSKAKKVCLILLIFD